MVDRDEAGRDDDLAGDFVRGVDHAQQALIRDPVATVEAKRFAVGRGGGVGLSGGEVDRVDDAALTFARSDIGDLAAVRGQADVGNRLAGAEGGGRILETRRLRRSSRRRCRQGG
jgi:hypothetical protein